MELKRLGEEEWKGLFQTLFEQSSEAIIVLDRAGRIVDLNQRASDSLGRARHELIGQSPGKIPVPVRVVPVGVGAHQLALAFAGGQSESTGAQEALQASEERFRTLVQLSFDVYWETDTEHRFTRQEFSPRVPDPPLPGSEIGKTRWEVPYLEPDEDAWRAHRATMEAHLPFRDFEVVRPTPAGGKRYMSVSGFPVHDRSGSFVGYRGVGRHITPLKRAEAERRAHLWFLESMDRINRAIQARQDLDGMAGEVLQALIDIFACDRAWLVHSCGPQSNTWRAIAERTQPQCPPAFQPGKDVVTDPEAAAVFAAAKTSSRPVLLLPAGLADRFGARSQMVTALLPKGAQPYLLGLHQCLQARSWTEDEQRLFREIGSRLGDASTGVLAFCRLAESERRLEGAQRIAGVGWWERDILTGQVLASDEACRIFGVLPAELPQWQGRWLSFVDAADRPRTAAALEAALGGGPRYDVEYRLVRSDGSVRVVHSQADLIRDGSGRPVRLFGVMQDITGLRQAEEALQAARAELARLSRVMTMGELTASIAHEVNQPLGAMVANAGAAVRWLSADPANVAMAQRTLHSIADDGRRASEVIQRIRALVQRQPPRMALVGINETIADVVALAQQELRSNGVVLDKQLSKDLPAVLGDRIQLQQVLLNLIVNAIEAMSAVQDRRRELTIASRLDGPHGVLVQVRDTGPGLAREHAERLFESFYTTKPEGLGIGLSISRSIVEAHGGCLGAAPNAPHGAVFHFTLPAQAGASA